MRPAKSWSCALAIAFALLLSACEKCEHKAEVTFEVATSSSKVATPPEPPAKPPGAFSPWAKGVPHTVGPELIVLPGEGVSATRFGATFETIERHMEAPCEVRSESRCLYVARGIDFGMKDGVLDSIKIHRRDRIVPGLPEKRYFGAFKGRLGQSILLGLHRHIVVEEFGKPEKITEAPAGAENGLVESHYYPGLVLEYDRIENGNVVLSAFEIKNQKAAKQPSPTPH